MGDFAFYYMIYLVLSLAVNQVLGVNYLIISLFITPLVLILYFEKFLPYLENINYSNIFGKTYKEVSRKTYKVIILYTTLATVIEAIVFIIGEILYLHAKGNFHLNLIASITEGVMYAINFLGMYFAHEKANKIIWESL